MRIAIIALVLCGCSDKKPDPPAPVPGPVKPPPTPVITPPPGKPELLDEAVAKRLDDCWAMWSAGKYEEYEHCFAADATRELVADGTPAATGPAAIVAATKAWRRDMPDAVAEPVLELVNYQHLFAITRISGTNAKTKRRVGFLFGQALELASSGTFRREWVYYAPATARQVADMAIKKQVALSRSSEVEKANAKVLQKAREAFDKHDTAAFGALHADGLVWTDVGTPVDWTKDEVLKGLGQAWQAMPDMQMVVTTQWTAGDFVVVLGAMMGTTKQKKAFNGPFMSVHHLTGGKIDATWVLPTPPRG